MARPLASEETCGATAMETISAAVTCIAAAALEPDKEAVMVAVPAATAATAPSLPGALEISATLSSELDQSTLAVTSCIDPSLNTPEAKNLALRPLASEAAAGEICSEVRMAARTVTSTSACT